MRIFKYKWFNRWARNESIDDMKLENAVAELANGLFEANLGGGLYKKRVARWGQGKRDGYRTLVAFKKDNIAIFIYGFAKNRQKNIGEMEKEILKTLAASYLNASTEIINNLIKTNEIIEVKNEKKTEKIH